MLTGRVNPSGRLPVSFPGGRLAPSPSTYLGSPLAHRTEVTSVDPTPLFPFGHGLGYAQATWGAVELVSGADAGPPTASPRSRVELANDADREVSEVVQVYLHDRAASVVRPVQRLVAAVRVDLAPGRAAPGAHRAARRPRPRSPGATSPGSSSPARWSCGSGRSSADHEAVLGARPGRVRALASGADRVLEPDITVEGA